MAMANCGLSLKLTVRAGSYVVIEECMVGPELSILAFSGHDRDVLVLLQMLAIVLRAVITLGLL